MSPFTDALQAEVATLQAKHPILAGALDRAFALVTDGGVFPLEDGRTAHVRSQSDPTVSHLVNGTCDCKATQYHAAPCAHRLAFRVYQRTVERLTVDLEERWEPVEAPEATPPAPQPLPEAPASANCHITIAGRQVQLTLRDTDEGRLLERLATVLKQYPLPQVTGEQGRSSAPTQEGAYCLVHNCAMQENLKNGQRWFSHKKEDGSWCKGKGR
jgi:hypothetical protein